MPSFHHSVEVIVHLAMTKQLLHGVLFKYPLLLSVFVSVMETEHTEATGPAEEKQTGHP